MPVNDLTSQRFFWAIALALLAGFLGAVIWLSTKPKPAGWGERPLEGLGTFGAVPDFSLTERSGKQVRRSDLSGKVWVANFMYTSCTDTCPLQSAELAKLQSELGDGDNVKIVSISVDPERDKPQVLARYADRFKASPDRWYFLTGDKNEIYRLAQDGFHLSAMPASEHDRDDDGSILHSSKFILVDNKAEIRGYYESNDAEALQRLRRDMTMLLKHKS